MNQTAAWPVASSARPIPMQDLKAQYRTLAPQIEEAVRRVFDSQQFILGPEVEAFEQELADYLGVPCAIGVASGSDALLLPLLAMGIGAGDEIITSPYTFFATGGAIARVGAKPVFVDIDPKSFTLSIEQVSDYLKGKHPVLNDVNRFDCAPGRVKAIMPVHLFGQCAEMKPLLEVASSREISIIEDAAQALSSRYQGQFAGTLADVGALSFFPSKNLGGAGDGGAIVTRDPQLAERIRVLRVHGAMPKYFHAVIGLNSRLDAIQAAILRVKLPYLEKWSESRREVADRYENLLADLAEIVLPWRRRGPGERHIFNQYVVSHPRRDSLQTALRSAKIGCEIYYPRPLHLQECFGYLGYKSGDLPHAEKAAATTLALPMFSELELWQQQMVARTLAAAL
jgi:dTDP-4-amino-4,6-dideoxygalactose transaminase